jgi:tetratricopeptide (TPR) repeat protein
MAAYREAALCFDRAIELGIAAPECYRNFVYAYERLEGVDASVRFFNSQCHRDPKNPHLWYAVALAYWSKRDYPTVLKNLEEALSRNPTEQKYLQAKAAILVLLNRGSEGAEAISDLLSNTMKADDLNDSQFLRSYLVLAHELGGDSSVAKAGTWENLVQARKFGMYRWIGWGYERMADYEFLSCNFEIALSFSTKAIEASRKCADQNLLVAGLVRCSTIGATARTETSYDGEYQRTCPSFRIRR